MERRDFTVTVAGLGLHVTEWGAREARPVVMLHGIRGFAETFVGVAEALQPEFRVIAFDQRGRGDSDWDPERNYYTDTYVNDLLAVVDTLGIDRFDLLGHSMGGINAIVFASLHPDRVERLIIEDAGPGAFEHSPGVARIRREMVETPVRFDDWSAASEFMRGLRPSVTEEARQQRLRSMLKALPDGGYTWRYDHAGIAAIRLEPDGARVPDLRPHVAALRCDTLVLRGAQTDYLQAEMAQDMCRLNPKVVTTDIAGAGHYVHDDQPVLFNQTVRDFLLSGAAKTDTKVTTS
ncbi:alpha/beta fold hydrolase [Nitrogeniibacter aestuarii]|uniref:alpha/beta fold hydrolase n=1 Tax=Nitrogeniibacter aestuarii TaxID=2815343 RepID=UPI001D10BF99|nr:alpha/beta hydrolase [Nitrogeniibacter aestuarii]